MDFMELVIGLWELLGFWGWFGGLRFGGCSRRIGGLVGGGLWVRSR